jgi:hypothetical protein
MFVPVGFNVAADDVGDFQAGLQVSLGSRVREAGLGGHLRHCELRQVQQIERVLGGPTVCGQASAVAG